MRSEYPPNINEVMALAGRLMAESAAALDRGDAVEAARLHRAADDAWKEAKRLAARRTKRIARPLSDATSMRERALQAVTQLGVLCSPKLIASYSQARTGLEFDVKALASIRRDERRSWEKSNRRDAYLVPALEGPWFAASRGRFALSSWPLWRRIIGPLTPRTDHLRVCIRLAETIDKARDWEVDPAAMLKLLHSFAITVPNALKDSWAPPAEIDLNRARTAAEEELALHEQEDEVGRKQAAERATRMLDETQQLWGGGMPTLVQPESA
jgi:hypothetical protein